MMSINVVIKEHVMIFDNIILDDLDEELTEEQLCQKNNK